MPRIAPLATGLLNQWRVNDLADADGAAVTNWASQVGGVTLTQATAANRATMRTNRVNGKKALDWGAVANTKFYSGTIVTDTQPTTWVAIVSADASISTNQHQVIHSTQELHTETGGWKMYAGTSIAAQGTVGTGYMVITAVYNGASSQIYKNGTLIFSGSIGTAATGTALNIGRHPTSGRQWRGDMAEVLRYSTALDAIQRAEVHSYVQDFYGITVADYVPTTGNVWLSVMQQELNDTACDDWVATFYKFADDTVAGTMLISDADGFIPLDAGTYKIKFEAPGRVSEFYNDQTSLATANSYVVTAGTDQFLTVYLAQAVVAQTATTQTPVTAGLTSAAVEVGLATTAAPVTAGLTSPSFEVDLATASTPASAGLTSAAVAAKTASASTPVAVGLTAPATAVKWAATATAVAAGLSSVAQGVKFAGATSPVSAGLASPAMSLLTASVATPADAGLTAQATAAQFATTATTASAGLASTVETTIPTVTTAMGVTAGLSAAVVAVGVATVSTPVAASPSAPASLVVDASAAPLVAVGGQVDALALLEVETLTAVTVGLTSLASRISGQRHFDATATIALRTLGAGVALSPLTATTAMHPLAAGRISQRDLTGAATQRTITATIRT